MKYTLLFFILFPLYIFAQNDWHHSEIEWVSCAQAKTKQIKLQKHITVLTSFHSGVAAHDTVNVSTQEYDANGNIIKRTLAVDVDKSHYKTRTDYFYDNKGQTIRFVSYETDANYENQKVIDSTVVLQQLPHYKATDYRNGDVIAVERIGDSLNYIETKKRAVGKDTVVEIEVDKCAYDQTGNISSKQFYRTRSFQGITDTSVCGITHFYGSRDFELTYYFKGKFYAHFKTHFDSLLHTDTFTYFNKKEKCIMTIVDHLDSLNHVTNADYFNKRNGNYKVYNCPYNDLYNMSFYLPLNLLGKMRYQVVRNYNTKGLIISEKHISLKKKKPLIELIYQYEYYQ